MCHIMQATLKVFGVVRDCTVKRILSVLTTSYAKYSHPAWGLLRTAWAFHPDLQNLIKFLPQQRIGLFFLVVFTVFASSNPSVLLYYSLWLKMKWISWFSFLSCSEMQIQVLWKAAHIWNQGIPTVRAAPRLDPERKGQHRGKKNKGLTKQSNDKKVWQEDGKMQPIHSSKKAATQQEARAAGSLCKYLCTLPPRAHRADSTVSPAKQWRTVFYLPHVLTTIACVI